VTNTPKISRLLIAIYCLLAASTTAFAQQEQATLTFLKTRGGDCSLRVGIPTIVFKGQRSLKFCNVPVDKSEFHRKFQSCALSGFSIFPDQSRQGEIVPSAGCSFTSYKNNSQYIFGWPYDEISCTFMCINN
jgi:hypothetical protein